MRGAILTFPPAGSEHPYARHTAARLDREWGRVEPPPAPWRPRPQPDAAPPWQQGSPAEWSGAATGGTWFADYGQAAPTDSGYHHEHTVRAYSQVHEPTAEAWEQALPDLRNKIVNRLASMNWNQAMATWERRRRDPLNPHVLVFFFAEPPTGTPRRCELRVAARLFPAGDEQRLAMLLYELIPVVRDHLQAGRDPDRYVFSWHDRRTRQARYAGLGVTTLDTPAGSWSEVQRVVARHSRCR